MRGKQGKDDDAAEVTRPLPPRLLMVELFLSLDLSKPTGGFEAVATYYFPLSFPPSFLASHGVLTVLEWRNCLMMLFTRHDSSRGTEKERRGGEREEGKYETPLSHFLSYLGEGALPRPSRRLGDAGDILGVRRPTERRLPSCRRASRLASSIPQHFPRRCLAEQGADSRLQHAEALRDDGTPREPARSVGYRRKLGGIGRAS